MSVVKNMTSGNMMKTEVSVAASFLSGLLSSSDSLTGDQLQIFTHTLTDALMGEITGWMTGLTSSSLLTE